MSQKSNKTEIFNLKPEQIQESNTIWKALEQALPCFTVCP